MSTPPADTPRFVVEDIPDGVVTLSADQSHHLSRVLRLKVGDPVIVINGKGTFAQGEVAAVHGKHAQVLVRSREQVESTARIGIAFALPKPQALDFVIRRCTEVGVAHLQPLISDHSSPRRNWNADRWHRIVEEVCKQCQRTHFPVVRAPLALEEFLRENEGVHLCDEQERGSKPSSLEAGTVWGLIGPEGGWSAAEREIFKAHGLKHLGLGSCRLRAETACLVAATRLMELANEI